MDEVAFLILLNFSIAIGSYFAGTIPMIFHLSEAKLRRFSVFGAGILMGTALCVIIPEGVNSIYETTIHSHNAEKDSDVTATNKPVAKENSHDPHTIVGITLLFGFVTMLIIDQFSSAISSSPHYSHLPTNDTETGNGRLTAAKKASKFIATIGLIVHSAADGIALGAAATTSHADVEMVVFLAIMLHKAPAAFGLVTFLLHEGLDRAKVKRHLLFFSLSAPLASFVTYFGISSSAKEALSDYNATGISLLFSAGTFLYVAAVHVLPEITQQQRLKITELGLLVFGSFLPPLLTIKHHH